MGFCRKCGSELRQDEKFCAKCGFSVKSRNVQEAKRKPIWIFIVIAVLLFVTGTVVGIVVSGAQKDNDVSHSKEEQEIKSIDPKDYDDSGSCGTDLMWGYDAKEKMLVIVGSGDMDYFDMWQTPWAKYAEEVKTIKLPDEMTSIGDHAFAYFGELEEVTIPDSVTSIGENAFWDCRSLTQVSIPAAVEYIGAAAFASCSSLTEITIPAGITAINRGMFWSCISLTEVTIPESVISIDYDAFCACTDLMDVYYEGSRVQWDEIDVGVRNEDLLDAQMHYGK